MVTCLLSSVPLPPVPVQVCASIIPPAPSRACGASREASRRESLAPELEMTWVLVSQRLRPQVKELSGEVPPGIRSRSKSQNSGNSSGSERMGL